MTSCIDFQEGKYSGGSLGPANLEYVDNYWL